ncbi:immunity protein YezG family protein [Nocardiopsis dassonvillei]|nr:immunity protein YezG family protein [Nocardiopsis dassonvillei]
MGLMIDDLRAGMYQEGKGTWFSFEYVITPPGRFNVTYNYDEDPGITFPTAFGYTNDLKYFPRDEEYMTDWLREKLQEEAEGRAME